MTFKAEIRALIGWNWSQGALDSGRLDYARALTEGFGDGEAEAVWHAEDEPLSSGHSITLDLTALQRDVLGSLMTTTLLSVKGLLVINAGSSVGNLVVGGAGGAEWSAPLGADGDTIVLPPDGALMLSNLRGEWRVDDANKLLKLAASGGDVAYSLVLLGTLTATGSGSSGVT